MAKLTYRTTGKRSLIIRLSNRHGPFTVTHFWVCANQFLKSVHLRANHFFAVCMLCAANGFQDFLSFIAIICAKWKASFRVTSSSDHSSSLQICVEKCCILSTTRNFTRIKMGLKACPMCRFLVQVDCWLEYRHVMLLLFSCQICFGVCMCGLASWIIYQTV